MSEERTKILNLLADGKITVADAERLLAAVGEPTVALSSPARAAEGCCDGAEPECCDGAAADCCAPASTEAVVTTVGSAARKAPKYLCVRVDGKDKVNVRVPLALVRAGIKLGTLLPKEAKGEVQEKLAASGVNIDLSGKNFDELLNQLHDLNVDILDKDGTTVKVCCE